MPPKNIQLGEGTLYFKTETGEEPLGEITEVEEMEFAEDADPVIRPNIPWEFEFFADMSIYPYQDLVQKLIRSYKETVLRDCPNRRVAHLVAHGKNARTRLKNWRRALKLQDRRVAE